MKQSIKIEQEIFYAFLKKHRAYRRWKRLNELNVNSIESVNIHNYVSSTINWSSENVMFWKKLDDEWENFLKSIKEKI